MDADPIIVIPYDPAWPVTFERERQRISTVIDLNGTRIEHVGSTAVPGLAAKPVIDIMIGLKCLADAPPWIGVLQALGYDYIQAHEDVMPERRFFKRLVMGVRTSHIHLVETGSSFWIRHLAFRDFLRSHPEHAVAYGQLKTRLALQHRDDREAYMDGKDSFIKEVEGIALRENHR